MIPFIYKGFIPSPSSDTISILKPSLLRREKTR
nr:MAG TPA: hypothetical protein [Caudoviricetes sp.]